MLRACAIVGLLGPLLLASCNKSGEGGSPPGEGATKQSGNSVVFTDSKGRQLTEDEMANSSGKFDWSVVGRENVSERARQLHEAGREEGGKGNYAHALELFKQASEAAPAWPYPVYDAAFTHLLQGDVEEAERLYQQVDQMAPRGFFTAKTAVDCLRRERSGELKLGMYKAFVLLEDVQEEQEKRSILEQMVKACPRFPAAWKELAVLRPDDASKLNAIEHGMSENPDGETKGILLINKAIILDRKGDRDSATRILGELALDPQSTLATESMAKFTLANLLKHK